MRLNKEHLNVHGFLKSIAIINNLNYPIKQDKLDMIIKQFGTLPALILPPVTIFNKFVLIPSAWWIIGFIVGEGTFTYSTVKAISKLGTPHLKYHLVFAIIQHSKDLYNLEAIRLFLGGGSVHKYKHGIANFRIESILLVKHILLPFLTQYPLEGHKDLQFKLWFQAALIKLAFYKKRDEEDLILSYNKLKPIIDDLSALSPSKKKENKKLLSEKVILV